MARFLMKTYSSNEEYNADCDYAVVCIGPEDAELILSRRSSFLAASRRDRDTLEFYYWNGLADYLQYSDASPLTEKQTARLEDGRYIRIPQRLHLNMEYQNVECGQMIIDDAGVRWTAIPKHTSLCVTTERIPYSEIERIVKGGGK